MDDSTRPADAWHLSWVIADLERLEASGHLGPEGRLLLQRYRDWRVWLSAPAGAAPPPSGGVPAAPAAAPPSPGIDLRRLISAHGVLLLSWAGALLLISAAVLFLAYGPAGIGGGARAGAVVGLDVALAAVAMVCHRRAALRLVEETYLALTALTLPLSLAAIYGYVLRGSTGMTASTAVALGGALCAVIYERLATRLRSTAYATLCLAVAATAAVSAAIATGLGDSALPGVALIGLAGWLLTGRAGSPFERPGRWLGIAANVGGTCAAVAAASHQTGGSTPRALFLPLTLAALAAVSLVPALRRGRAGMGWASVLLASATPLALAWSLGASGGTVDLVLALTALGTAGVAVVPWSLLGRVAFGGQLSFTLTLSDSVALLATLEAIVAATRSTRVDVDVIAAAAATLGAVLAALRRGEHGPVWLWLAPLPVAAVAFGALDRAGDTLPEHWPVGVPSGLAVVLAALAVVALRRRLPILLPWLSAGLTVAALTAVSAWQLGQAGYAASLVILGVLQIVLAPVTPASQRTLSWWGAGVRLAIAACVVVSPTWFEAVLSAGAFAGAALLAVETRRAVAGLLACALGASAWYWVVSAVAGGPLGRHPAAIALAPLVVLSAAGLILAGDRLRRGGGDLELGLRVGTGGLVVLTFALGLGDTGIVLGLTLGACLVRGRVGLGLAVLAALWALGSAAGASGIPAVDVGLALAGMAATLATAALVATDPSWPAPRVGRWMAVVIAAAALDWLCLAAHLQEAQAYAVVPALAAICCGLAARGDTPPEGRPDVAVWLLGGGLLLLLGSSGLEALGASSGSWYLPLLLGEAIAVLVVAVVAESRLCAAAAGVALAAVCLRALGIAASGLPLYAVFGGCALVLLAGSVGLALERERVARLRQTVQRWGP